MTSSIVWVNRIFTIFETLRFRTSLIVVINLLLINNHQIELAGKLEEKNEIIVVYELGNFFKALKSFKIKKGNKGKEGKDRKGKNHEKMSKLILGRHFNN